MVTFDSGTALSSVPNFAAKHFKEQGIPLSDNVIKCNSEKQFGDMTYVIGGKDYTLTNKEWMTPAKNIALVQKGSKLHFDMGPLGPEIMI